MKKFRHLFSLVLTFALLIGIAPMSVFALECTPETEHAILVSNSTVVDFNAEQAPTANEIPADGFIEGAVYRIVQTQGAYNPATQTYAAADTNIDFQFTIDFDAATVNPQGLDGQVLDGVSVTPIKQENLNNDPENTYSPLVDKGMRIVLPNGTYELTEVTPAEGYDTYDIRGWDRKDETTPVFRNERDGAGEKPSIVLEIPRTDANGACESLEAWVNFKAIPTLVDIEITKLDGETTNQDQPLANAKFGIYKKVETTDPYVIEGAVNEEGFPYVVEGENKIQFTQGDAVYAPFDLDKDTEGMQNESISVAETGIAKFENIPYGEYLVKETQVPDKTGASGQSYLLSPVVHIFTISSDNYSEEVTEDGAYLYKKDVVDYTEPVVKKGIEGSSTVYPGSDKAAQIQLFERQEVFNYTLDIELPNDIKDYIEFSVTDVNQNPGKIDFGTAQEIVYYNRAEADQLRQFEDGIEGVVEPDGTTIFTNTATALENITNAGTSYTTFTPIVKGAGDVTVLEQQFVDNTLVIKKPALTEAEGDAQTAAWAAQFPEGGILRIKVPAKFTNDAVVKDGGHLNTFTLEYVANPVSKGEKDSNEVKTNPKSMELKLIKTNSMNEGEEGFLKLDGASFKLKPVKGTAAEELNVAANTRDIVMNFGDGTDPNQPALGEIVVQNLDFGTYELTEVKAPEGYRLLDKPLTIELVEGEDVSFTFTVKNYLTDEFLPQTGTGLMVSVAVIGAGTLAGALVLGRKKEEDEE